MRFPAILLCAAMLSGCAAQNIAEDPSTKYSEADRAAAKWIADGGSRICIRTRYADQTNDQSPMIPGGKIVSPIEVRRLYQGQGTHSDWYKAEAVTSGAWDNIYLNAKTRAMICGEKQWQSFANSSEIRFLEVGTQVKRLPQ